MAVTDAQIARWFKGGDSPHKIAWHINLAASAYHRTCLDPDHCAQCLGTVEGRLRRHMRRQDRRTAR